MMCRTTHEPSKETRQLERQHRTGIGYYWASTTSVAMATDKTEQIRRVHARFIHAVVAAAHNTDAAHELEQVLNMAWENGWQDAVTAVRHVLDGRRDSGLLQDLDEEDHAIVTGILEGLQNPSTLPDPETPAGDASMAAPGLAQIVSAAARGDTDALHWIGNLGEQMNMIGGDMGEVAARLRDLVNGERDVDKLTRRMSAKSRLLLLAVVEELGKLDLQ